MAARDDEQRIKALVDVLAIEDYEQRSQHIQTLALDWQVCNQYELSTLVMTQIIQRLARHVLEHGRGEANGA